MGDQRRAADGTRSQRRGLPPGKSSTQGREQARQLQAPLKSPESSQLVARPKSHGAAFPGPAALGGFYDGHWTHEADPGARLEVIDHDVIQWQEGVQAKLWPTGANRFAVRLES